MSRVGIKPITIPDQVTVSREKQTVLVKGPKGELSILLPDEVEMAVKEATLTVSLKSQNQGGRNLHGLYRTLINNMILGVKEGFSKKLELAGTGYRAKNEGEKLILPVGFSQPVIVIPPAGIQFKVEGDNLIEVSGCDKYLVGQMAANLRHVREPEPYKGKGLHYIGEQIRRKAGKQMKGAVA